MEDILDADAPLDYATIQFFPTQNRYEVFVCGNNKVEKLAVGPLEQLLPYVPGLKPLHVEGSCSKFTIQPPGKPSSTAWFSKSTFNRFLNIVSLPDLVNITKVIEGEMSQLEQARQFHLSLYVQGNNIGAGEIDDCNSNDMAPQTKSNFQSASSDTSKNELLRAMNLRISALRGELSAAFKQAAGAIFSHEELANLTQIFQLFGLADSNNSFYRALDTSQISQKSDPLDDDKTLLTCALRNDSARKTNGDSEMSKSSHAEMPVKYGVSPAKVAQLERQSSTESEDSSDAGQENQMSVERSRALVRSAAPRRSASPMRRIQIGKTGSRRATALTIKSLNYLPTKTLSHRDVAADSSEEEESEQTSKKIENNVRRMSVQDAINLFESKQRDQTADSQKKNYLANASLIGNKSVLRRWSSGVGESSAQSQPQTGLDHSSPVISNDTVDREFLEASAEVKSESDYTSNGQIHVETAEVDVEIWEERAPDMIDVQTDADVSQKEGINERLTASAEWNQQKEMELNQMLKKMMEIKSTKSTKPSTSRKHNLSSEKRGGFYNHYKEKKRDEKLRGENARIRAEKEAQFRAMQLILDERKAEMGPKNVNDVGKKHPLQKPQKSVRNLPRSANPKEETLKSAVSRKVSSKTSPLPSTRKSWPSGPSRRTAGISPARTHGAISSAGTTPTHQKLKSAQSFPRATSKMEQSKQQLRNLKETQANNERSLKGLNGGQQPTKAKSSKITKAAVARTSEDSSNPVLEKRSFYNKVTKKGSVVPLESKPFLRKGSRIGPSVGPVANKIKSSPQVDSLRNPQEKEAAVNASSLAMEHQELDTVPVDCCEAAVKSETRVSSQQICNEIENFHEPAADNDDGLKNMIGSSSKIQAEEESVISPSAWVEIEEEHHELPNAYHDNITQLASPANIVPIGLSSPHVRYSLSQMLQEESSELDISEWGNAEILPAMVYQKDAPKGLKRLLKFARKSKGESNSMGWSSPSVFSEGEDDMDESRAANKRNADNLLRKATFRANYGRQKTLLSEDYEKNVDAHLVSAQSNISRYEAQKSNNLHKGHVSAAAPTAKATRSFFSLSAFRGSKPNETKLH